MDITFEQFVTERTNVFNKNLWGLSLDSLQRFTEKIALGPFNEKLQSHCWEWGASLSSGYGVVYLYQPKKLAIRAHKLSHELVNGPVPPTWHVHHKCVNRLCVNPAHLEALEPSEHLSNREGSGAFLNKNKTHCKWGHEFNEENTVFSYGRRQCRECHRLRSEKRNHAIRDQRPVEPPATHCTHGHPLEGANLVLSMSRGKELRLCRICRYKAVEDYRNRQKTAPLSDNRTHCRRGHEFVEGSYAVYLGKKRCRQCERDKANAINARKRENKPIRTHCHNGHELVEPNIYWIGDHKYCHICKLESSRKYEEKRKEMAFLPPIEDPRNSIHCPAGHILDRENTFMSRGIKHCRICNNLVPPAPKQDLEAKPALFSCGHPRTPENSYTCITPSKRRPVYQCITCRQQKAPAAHLRRQIAYHESIGEFEKADQFRTKLYDLIGEPPPDVGAIDPPPLSA